MNLSVVFWFLMVSWLVLGATPHVKQIKDAEKPWSAMAFGLVAWAAVCILGWRVFGPIITG